MIEIDRRIEAKEFMQLLAIGKVNLYNMIIAENIQQPARLSDHDVFWYSSYVKNKVEEHKPKSDIVARNLVDIFIPNFHPTSP